MVQIYYLIGVFVATILGWVSWFVVLNKLSPFLSATGAHVFLFQPVPRPHGHFHGGHLLSAACPEPIREFFSPSEYRTPAGRSFRSCVAQVSRSKGLRSHVVGCASTLGDCASDRVLFYEPGIGPIVEPLRVAPIVEPMVIFTMSATNGANNRFHNWNLDIDLSRQIIFSSAILIRSCFIVSRCGR